jgi:hypothetical protein
VGRTYTNHTGYYRSAREPLSEWLLIANAVLDDDNGSLLLVDGWRKLLGYRRLIDSLMSADDVVETGLGLCRCSYDWETMLRDIFQSKADESQNGDPMTSSSTSIRHHRVLSMVRAGDSDTLVLNSIVVGTRDHC